jgi:hypothetical protein
MLAALFQAALRVTENVPSYKARRDAVLGYYLGHQGKGGNVLDWLRIAQAWAPGSGCQIGYFANNITMMPMYTLARFETDPARRSIVVDSILGQKMWPEFETTKNPFFSYIYAGVRAGTPAGIVTSATSQLGQFPAAPRIHVPTDHRTNPKYAARDSQCAEQLDHGSAVDVGDRVVDGFLWQRHPWGLYDPGNAAQTHSGVDYLVAYWLGRRHDFLREDAAGRCMAWQ